MAEQEPKKIKIKLGTVICIIIIILLLLVIGGIYYNYIKCINDNNCLKNNNTMINAECIPNKINNENQINNNITENNTTTIDNKVNEGDLPKEFTGYIKEGYLYYSFGETSLDENGKSIVSTNGSYQKYTNLDNIKQIIKYNLGTSVHPMTLLITKDGKVYELDNYIEPLEVNLFEELKNYNVKEILSITGETKTIIELLLSDGTETTVIIDLGI